MLAVQSNSDNKYAGALLPRGRDKMKAAEGISISAGWRLFRAGMLPQRKAAVHAA